LRAYLIETSLTRADLTRANLAFTIFEPKLESIENVRAFRGVENLSKMRFDGLLDAMVALREAFKRAGMREQERQVRIFY
jgi:hypothetical protein